MWVYFLNFCIHYTDKVLLLKKLMKHHNYLLSFPLKLNDFLKLQLQFIIFELDIVAVSTPQF